MDKAYESISYAGAGVDIDNADDFKRSIAGAVSAREFAHCKPLNKIGAFASLLEIGLGKYREPVFVLKSEEPGSKQVLSIDNDRPEWIARDLINHLVNDIIVMGATPCAVLDTVICGKIEKGVLLRLINAMSEACADNGCILIGGETSEQPGVLPVGRYILQAGVLGVAEKSEIIDGCNITPGDEVIALASNGLHTNGYSLVRKLMETKPEIQDEKNFLDCILRPHMSYFKAVNTMLDNHRGAIHGMAHITGGGIHDNLIRILPSDDIRAVVDLSLIKAPPIFGLIKRYAGIGDAEMLRTFNSGVGMAVVADGAKTDEIIVSLADCGFDAYRIGRVERGPRDVEFINKVHW